MTHRDAKPEGGKAYDDKAAEELVSYANECVREHDTGRLRACAPAWIDHLDSARAEIKRRGEEIERLKRECRVLSGSLSLQEMTSERLRKLCGEAADKLSSHHGPTHGEGVACGTCYAGQQAHCDRAMRIERLRKAESGE